MKQIVKLSPHLEFPIWSGTRLSTDWWKQPSQKIGEAFLTSVLPCKESRVTGATGAIPKADNLAQLLALEPNWAPSGVALLLKLIDTDSLLSVQVHPSDKYALANENSLGKTEAWYILDAVDGAFIYLGFTDHCTTAQIETAVADGSICDLMRRVPVRKGDYFFIPAGTVHALGAGITVAEIQQSSNVTYRLFDYNRPGTDGKPRQLHVQKALDVLNTTRAEDTVKNAYDFDDNKLNRLYGCEFFNAYSCFLSKPASYFFDNYCLLTVTAGDVLLKCQNGEKTLSIGKGECAFIPAALEFSVLTEKAEILLFTA